MPQIHFEGVAAPTYTLKLLDLDGMINAYQVMQDTRAALSPQEKHFLKPQDLQMLNQHINRGFPVLGAVQDHTGLLAGVLMITPTKELDLCNNIDGYPDHLLSSDAAIVQCVAVHPDFRRQGIMPFLLESADKTAKDMGIQKLVAKVADANIGSWQKFKDAGFHKSVHGTDSKLGYAVTYWQKELSQGLAIDMRTGPNVGNDTAKPYTPANI